MIMMCGESGITIAVARSAQICARSHNVSIMLEDDVVDNVDVIEISETHILPVTMAANNSHVIYCDRDTVQVPFERTVNVH